LTVDESATRDATPDPARDFRHLRPAGGYSLTIPTGGALSEVSGVLRIARLTGIPGLASV